MIGRWGKAAAFLVLGSAAVVDLGLATALLDQAPRDLPAAWTRLAALAAPGPRLALAGRQAIVGGAVAGAASAGAALLLGPAVAQLAGPARALLLALLRLPALTLLLLGAMAGLLLVADSGPIAAALAGFAVATRKLGARWTLAVLLLPVAVGMVEAQARQLDRGGFESLATLGIGPLRRLLTIALPGVLPAAIRAAVGGFCAAGCALLLQAWPVPARQQAVAAAAAMLDIRPLAALAFCAAAGVAILAALLERTAEHLE